MIKKKSQLQRKNELNGVKSIWNDKKIAYNLTWCAFQFGLDVVERREWIAFVCDVSIRCDV